MYVCVYSYKYVYTHIYTYICTQRNSPNTIFRYIFKKYFIENVSFLAPKLFFFSLILPVKEFESLIIMVFLEGEGHY